MSAVDGKSIVISGGSGGLGLAVVSHLAAAGARCHLPLFEGEVPAAVSAISGSVQCATGVNLTDEDQVVAYYAQIAEPWASVHLAGGFSMAPIIETSAAEFERLFRLNTLSCFLCCREAVRSGAKRIVNVGARPAVAPVGGMSAYVASKAAVVALTQGLAEECKGSGVLVNAVLPSIIDTEANRLAMPDADHGSWPAPSQIAEMISFLVSEKNELSSGALIPVYGAA